jgi:hypothetical protein
MSELEFENRNKSSITSMNKLHSEAREKLAGFLIGVPEPAMQATAIQIIKSPFAFDKSFGYCLCLIGFAILEELF